MRFNFLNSDLIDQQIRLHSIEEPGFVGTFNTVANERKRNFVRFELFELDEFDRRWLAPVALETGWRMFRVRTKKTRIAQMSPLVQVNIAEGRVRFADCNRDDEQIHFSRSYKCAYLNIHEKFQ